MVTAASLDTAPPVTHARLDPIDLGEYESRDVRGYDLTEPDRRLAAELAKDQRLFVDELRDGLRVRSTSWVGVIPFDRFDVRVLPKHLGTALDVVRMLDYALGLDALDLYSGDRSLPADESLNDLLGRLLADQCEAVVREGLLKDYVPHEETLAALRGRIRLMEQLTRRLGRIDQLECAFDELETDTVENRILAAGLVAARRVCHGRDVVARLSRLDGVFREACDPSALVPDVARATLEYHRRNDHYRRGHELAWLFLEHRAIGDLFGRGRVRSMPFLLDMNRLFEAFVTRLLRDGLAPYGITVHAQRRDATLIHDEIRGRRQGVVPDMLLGARGPSMGGLRRLVPVDAKYKLYDDRDLEPADVYQTFFYAYAYGRERATALGELPRAVILYPSKSTHLRSTLRVRSGDGVAAAAIDVIGVDVTAALHAIRTRSLNAVDTVERMRDVFSYSPSA